MTVQQTSLLAYREILPSLQSKEAQVYRELEKTVDLTNHELSLRLGWEICCVTGRTNSLVKKGLVIKSCVRRNPATGKFNIAWKVNR